MPSPLNQIQKDALIELYATNNINDLDTQPALITLIFAGTPEINSIAEIENKIPGYKEFIIHVRTIKGNLEQVIQLKKTEAQVRYCLIQLTNIVEQDEAVRMNIFNEMVEKMLLKGFWSDFPDLVKKYREISRIIQTWNHFFVSYTTRDTPAVNNLYDPELFNQFDPHLVEKERVGNNLIARFIVKCLKDYNNLKVFFDRESIICGDIIADEVYEYCEKTFAFVQLIEDISFNSKKDKINWCFNEYEYFENHDENNKKSKYFFLIDGFDVITAAVPISYFNWADDIVKSKYEKIRMPFDVVSVKKKCQEFAILIKQRRLDHINDLIMAVV